VAGVGHGQGGLVDARRAIVAAHHLGHEKKQVPDRRESTNVRNGTRPKTVLTEATGQVEIEVSRDRDGSFEPVIVRKRRRRLNGVDEIVLPAVCQGMPRV